MIAKAGRPVARLVPVVNRPARREPGEAAGKVVIGEDFDAPLPEDRDAQGFFRRYTQHV